MKVLIVDDDSLVRIGLKSVIDWKGNGFELIGEASDGSNALAFISAHQPDIIITDIKMPVMNGLEMMKQLVEMNNSAKILILSSHDEFHFVKEAMKLGAEDYLLKLEIEPESLISILKKTARKIEERRMCESKKAGVERQMIKNINVMRKNFLKDLIHQFYTNENEMKECMNSLNIRLHAEYIYCFMIKAGEFFLFEEASDQKLHILSYSLMNIAEEIVGDLFNGYCFEGKSGEFYLLASSKKELNGVVRDHKLLDLGKRLRDMLEQYLNITATVGIGVGKGDLKGIQEACAQAVNAVKSRFFDGNEGVILWKEGNLNTFLMDSFSILHIKERLHHALSFQQKEELEAVFKVIQEEILGLPLSKRAVCNATLELFYMISEYCEFYQIKMEKMLLRSNRSYQQLIHMESLVLTKKWIQEVLEDLMNFIDQEEKTSYSRCISRAKKYLEDHFYEDISLQELADEVNLNPSYFSTLLKRYTGLSFSECLMQVRVEKAKELLAKSEYKVYEVGEKVGYQNKYYFNRIFKKIVGISPGEYKRKMARPVKVSIYV